MFNDYFHNIRNKINRVIKQISVFLTMILNADHISLFLHIEDPMATLIIDNRLVGCEEHVGYERRYQRAYGLLIQLFSDSHCRNAFPKQLRHHFEDKDLPQIEKPHHCLIGYDFTPENTFDYFACLELIASINLKETESVLLTDFKYEGIPLKIKLKLTPEEAFLTFSNICANVRCVAYEHILFEQKKKKLNKAAIIKNLKDSQLNQLLPIDFFILDYLDYLRKSFEERELEVFDILRMS